MLIYFDVKSVIFSVDFFVVECANDKYLVPQNSEIKQETHS